MAVVQLPGWAAPNEASPYVRDFGGILTPFLGGPEIRINRLGTRFGLRVSLHPMRSRDQALIIQSRLLQGREDRLIMGWRQPGFDAGDPGAPKLSANVVSGMVLPLKDMTPGYLIREGQFFSIIHAGRRYMHMFRADAIVDPGGNVNAAIWPMIRTGLSTNDIVEIVFPQIEGQVSPGEEMSWQISVAKLASFSFTIAESA